MTRAFLVSLCFGLLGIVGLVGCGGGGGPAGPTLKGKATIDGQPFVGIIYVTNLTTKETATGSPSEKDGSFTVVNAPLGEVKIHVEPGSIFKGPTNLGARRPPGAPPPLPKEPKGLPPKDAPESDYPPYLKHLAKNPALRDALERSQKVDPKFKSADDSPLKTEIKPGTNNFDATMTSSAQ
jgi:hypothetical protein